MINEIKVNGETVILKKLKEWIALYGKSLISAKTHMPDITDGRWHDGAVIIDVYPGDGDANFRSAIDSFESRGGYDLLLGIYEDSYLKLKLPDFIQQQVRERLRVEI